MIEELPRRASGEVRSEILQLVAMNQVDLIEPLIADERERAMVARIVADRRNLRDRFCVLAKRQRSAPVAEPRARSAIAAAMARSRPARTGRSRRRSMRASSGPRARPAATPAARGGAARSNSRAWAR